MTETHENRPVGPGWGGPLTDRSGTTPDAASNTVVPFRPGRMYLFVQNIDAAADLWLRFANDPVIGAPGSVQMAAGDVLIWGDGGGFCPDGSVHVISAAAGVPYTIWEG